MAEPSPLPGPSQNVGKGGTDSRKDVRTYAKDCAILIGDSGPVLASGKTLGHATKLDAQLGVFKPADEDPWFGIQIKIPLGKDQDSNEATGFGVLHSYSSTQDAILSNDEYVIQVRFPREKLKQDVKPASEKVAGLFPNAKALSYTIVSFDGAKPTVFGYGRPYANADDPQLEGWIRDNKPIIEGYTILDALQFAEYHLVVPIKASDTEKNLNPARLPPVFAFPHAIPDGWNLAAFEKDIAANPGHKYKPNYMLPNDGSLVTAMAQPVIQDMMWLVDAVNKMKTIKVPGYFVPQNVDGSHRYFVVVALPTEFIAGFDAAWRRLTRNAHAFNLLIWGAKEMTDHTADWDCRIMSHSESIEQFSNHPIKEYEVVLLVRRPFEKEKRNEKDRGHKYSPKTYTNRQDAENAFKESEGR